MLPAWLIEELERLREEKEENNVGLPLYTEDYVPQEQSAPSGMESTIIVIDL